jgi:hypothetical protein
MVEQIRLSQTHESSQNRVLLQDDESAFIKLSVIKRSFEVELRISVRKDA